MSVRSGLKVSLWNGDVLTIPIVKGKYRLHSVVRHMKVLLQELNADRDGVGFHEVMNR